MQQRRSRNLFGSCTYAGEHPAEGGCVEFYGLPEGIEQSDDLRAVWESEIQVQRNGVLVSRVLRRYGGEEQTEDKSGLQKMALHLP